MRGRRRREWNQGVTSAVQPSRCCCWLSYLHHLGVGGHLEGHAGAEGQAYHANAVTYDLRMFLQEFEGFLKQGQKKSTGKKIHSYNPLTPARTITNQ